MMPVRGLRGVVDRYGLPICLLLGVLGSVLQKQDASWDLRNYHLYNAWAMLHGRQSLDLVAAGMQSFFNPLLDLPYYLLGTGPLEHMPRVLAGLQGLWYGGLVFVLLRIAARLADLQGRVFDASDLFAVLIGATGTMAVSQLGMSSNEMPLALLVLLAICLLLPICVSEPTARSGRRVLLAGLLCGLAAGLKPTAIVYPPAMMCALLAASGWRHRAWRLGLLFAGAALGGFLVAYGWWGWALYRLTGNPVFPMFNQVFRSGWVPTVSGTDGQFLPRSIGQWLFYPFYWVRENQRVVTEVSFADPRYALGMLALLGLALSAWFRRRQPPRGREAMRLLAVFVALAYVAWLALFSILRYAIPIEALTGLLALAALRALSWRAHGGGAWRPWLAWCMAGLFLLSAGCSRYPNWGHVRYAGAVFDVRAPAVEPGSLVLVMGQPLAYVVPFIGNAQSSRFVGLTWFNQKAADERLGVFTRERLHDHIGPVYALLNGHAAASLPVLRQWLPGAQLAGKCEAISSAMERYPRDGIGVQLCRVSRR
ncbi:hypothetical protein [Rhodanobacter aciditrophus]|uniref:hypothetical protein n=1 Tax=Rhodanobacter aciditrophus TaxID=1623218 RepID=UPI003CF27173